MLHGIKQNIEYSNVVTYCQNSNISRTLAGKKIRWSLRRSWTIACRLYSNNIFILDLTPVFNGLGKANCKARRSNLSFWIGYVLY